jgi:hypothetical protein
MANCIPVIEIFGMNICHTYHVNTYILWFESFYQRYYRIYLDNFASLLDPRRYKRRFSKYLQDVFGYMLPPKESLSRYIKLSKSESLEQKRSSKNL